MCLGKINDVASWCSFSQAFQVLNANDQTKKSITYYLPVSLCQGKQSQLCLSSEI